MVSFDLELRDSNLDFFSHDLTNTFEVRPIPSEVYPKMRLKASKQLVIQFAWLQASHSSAAEALQNEP